MATHKGREVTLKKGDSVEVTIFGTVVSPRDYNGYIVLTTNAGAWSVSPKFNVKVTKPAAPSWWPPQYGDVIVVNNKTYADLPLVRIDNAWQHVDNVGYCIWTDDDVLQADPRLLVRNRKVQV